MVTPNQKLVKSHTYVWTFKGYVFLLSVIHCVLLLSPTLQLTRRVVGHVLATLTGMIDVATSHGYNKVAYGSKGGRRGASSKLVKAIGSLTATPTPMRKQLSFIHYAPDYNTISLICVGKNSVWEMGGDPQKSWIGCPSCLATHQ